MKKQIVFIAAALLAVLPASAQCTEFFDNSESVNYNCEVAESLKEMTPEEILNAIFSKADIPHSKDIANIIDKWLEGKVDAPDTNEPVIPENPETPEVPEIPDVPNVPEVPETPETPDVPETPDTESGTVSSYISEVVRLVNKERQSRGLSALSADAVLNKAADVRAKEIVKSFSHTRPDGTRCFTVLDELGYSYGTAGENIAYGQSSPSEVVNAWMNSEGHRANILSSQYTKIGVGCYQKGSTLYWSQFFAG